MGVVEEGNFVYGTDINEAEVKSEFRRFVRKFTLKDDEQPLYIQELPELGSGKLVKIRASSSLSVGRTSGNSVRDFMTTLSLSQLK